jgi:PAS domain S-box-containing protein
MSTWLTDARAFESLFSASPSAIFAVDRTHHVIGCNPACTLLAGYTKSEILGADLRTMANPPLRAFVEDAFEAASVE